MKEQFQKEDYLCVGPYCWGRAKTAREAFRLAYSNFSMSLFKRGAVLTFLLYRLSDDTDKVTVHDDGSFSFDSPSLTQPVLVARLTQKTKVNSVPEIYEPVEAAS